MSEKKKKRRTRRGTTTPPVTTQPNVPVSSAPSRHIAALLIFVVMSLFSLTTFVNTYLAKIPGFSEAIEWLKAFSTQHFGFYSFTTITGGALLFTVFSQVPSVSVAGLSFRNPLHQASSDKDKRAFEAQRKSWHEEKKHLNAKAERADGLEKELQGMRVVLETVRSEYDVAITNTGIYEFALKRCSHQDSILEKLFVGFLKPPADFAADYRFAMNWLANLSQQLVVNQDRSLNCTIMSYDDTLDTSEIVGEVGTSPTQSNRFLPKRGRGIAGRAIATQSPQIVSDVYSDSDYVCSTKSDDPRSLISVPVFNQGSVVGVVNICCRPMHAFGQTDLKTIQLAVDQIAAVMALNRLRQINSKQSNISMVLDSYLSEPDQVKGGESHDDDQTNGASGS